MSKTFTQAQALAMYKRLKELEAWLEQAVYDVGTDCVESDWLKEIKETLEVANHVQVRS